MRRLLRPLKAAAIGSLPTLNRLLERWLRIHLVRRHYYSPVPDPADLPAGYWEQISELPGVDLRLHHALEFLDEVVPRHIGDFRVRFPLHQTQGEDFYLINGTYMAVDAHVYWCLIHHFKPKRIVEIGAHASTMISTAAAASMRAAIGEVCNIFAIEPYPSDYLRREDRRSIVLIQKKVQELPLDFFGELESGDMLFIDSTHVLREGSDVQYEYLEILPRLKPGVLVHVHDISLPERYPKVYFDRQMFWNEQHLLQAFLAFNSRFEVIWPGNAMMLAHPEAMRRTFAEIDDMRAIYPSSEPTAFWMRVKQ